jgi:hypothetical protein
MWKIGEREREERRGGEWALLVASVHLQHQHLPPLSTEFIFKKYTSVLRKFYDSIFSIKQ